MVGVEGYQWRLELVLDIHGVRYWSFTSQSRSEMIGILYAEVMPLLNNDIVISFGSKYTLILGIFRMSKINSSFRVYIRYTCVKLVSFKTDFTSSSIPVLLIFHPHFYASRRFLSILFTAQVYRHWLTFSP